MVMPQGGKGIWQQSNHVVKAAGSAFSCNSKSVKGFTHLEKGLSCS